MFSRRDAHDEQAVIDATCAQLLAQPAAYAAPTGDASYTTAFWECDQIRVRPASEAQLHATEEQLGFPLPPFLRALYSRVANGGYGLGPANDFYGAEGGWPNRYRAEERTIGQLASRSGWRMHERIEAALMRHPGHYVLSDESPDGFIEVADYGCAISAQVDRHTGRVYHVGPGAVIPLADGEELFLRGIEFVAPSLAEWFRRWLDPTSGSAAFEDELVMPDDVDVSGLEDPDIVWRGLYRLELESAEPEDWEATSGDELPWWDGAVLGPDKDWIASEDDVQDVQCAPEDGTPDR